MVVVPWLKWPPCHYVVKSFRNLLQNEDALGLNLCINHWGWEVYQSWYNDGPTLTVDLFTVRSILLPCAFVWTHTFIWEKCWEFIFWTSPLKTMIQLSWNLIRSIVAPSRHKIAKIDEPIRHPRWLPQPSSWKPVFDISSQPFDCFELKLALY